MNGDGGSDQNGVDGQNISPSSVITGEVKTTDLTFTIARQADTLFGASNYVLPISKPPEDGSTYAICNSADGGGLFLTPSANATFSINLTTGANAQTVNVTFQPNTSFPIDIVLSSINDTIANWFSSVFSPSRVVLSLNTSSFPYRTDIFVSSAAASGQILNAGGTQHQVATFLGWSATSPSYSGINTFTSPNTNTVTQIIEIGNLCVWKKISTDGNVIGNKISSYDGSTSITCNDIGAIQSFGNVNYNGGNLSKVGSVSGTSVCNITTDTTQISNGSSQIKLITDSVDRLVIDNASTRLYTKSFLSGPNASFVELKDDGQFSVGSLSANNGIIEAGIGILSVVGGGATTAIEMVADPADMTFSVSNGISRVPRVTIDQTAQTFYDPTITERMKINSNGVTFNNAYRMPTSDGTLSQVLRTNGAGVVGWATPQVYGLFSQTSIKTVENTIAEISLIGAGVGSLTVPIGFFQNGYSFVYKTGGQWRTVAVSQSIRFRLRTNSFLFDTGLLLTTNVNTVRGWNIECQFTYYAGTIVTNFTFTYIDANNNTSGFVSRGNGVINNTVSNTIDLTVQWGGTANILNTITSDYGTLTKIF